MTSERDSGEIVTDTTTHQTSIFQPVRPLVKVETSAQGEQEKQVQVSFVVFTIIPLCILGCLISIL